MSAALIFDLDGVLVDSKEYHFIALNMALQDVDIKYVISSSEQLTTYEGLTTKDKLELLHVRKGLPKELFEYVWKAKQTYTSKIFNNLSRDAELVEIFKFIHDKGFKVGVVSNSIRVTLDVCLLKLGLKDLVDISLSNEDVSKPKPSPEGYVKAMEVLGVGPQSVAVFEDSIVGREAATGSGALLVPVNSRSDLNIGLVESIMGDLKRRESSD